MTKVFNRTDEKHKRKILKSSMPPAEVLLWLKLKGKGLEGYKFRRQYSVNNFVVDFYCPKLRLAIEIDGDSHFVEGADVTDKERQAIIESFGISFLRFTNKEIYENLDGILKQIMEYIKSDPLNQPPLPLLDKEGI